MRSQFGGIAIPLSALAQEPDDYLDTLEALVPVDDWSRCSALPSDAPSTAGLHISPLSSFESSQLSPLSLQASANTSLSPLLDLGVDDIISDDDVSKPAPQKRKASPDEE